MLKVEGPFMIRELQRRGVAISEIGPIPGHDHKPIGDRILGVGMLRLRLGKRRACPRGTTVSAGLDEDFIIAVPPSADRRRIGYRSRGVEIKLPCKVRPAPSICCATLGCPQYKEGLNRPSSPGFP